MNLDPNKRRNETHKKRLNGSKWTVESFILQEIHHRAQSYEIECGGHFIFRQEGIYIDYTFYDDLGDKHSFYALKALKRDEELHPNMVRFPYHTHVSKSLNDPVKKFYTRMIAVYPSHWDIGWAGVHEQQKILFLPLVNYMRLECQRARD